MCAENPSSGSRRTHTVASCALKSMCSSSRISFAERKTSARLSKTSNGGMNMSWIDKLQAKAAEEISQVWSQSVRTKQLRSFGLIVGCIFLVLGLAPVVSLLRHRHTWHPWLVLIAIALILPAILWPRLLRHPYRAWMLLGHILGWVNS